MFGFGNLRSPSGPIFVVGNSSLFSKKQLTPTDFGREITRLSITLGGTQLEFYQNGCALDSDDVRLLKLVERNPGGMQLLYANLIAGAFLCYARLMLRVPEKNIAEVESGVLSELRSTMAKIFPEEILEYHKNITVSFSKAIECEIQQNETDFSPPLFFRYVNDVYPEFDAGGGAIVPSGLFMSLTGLGSRILAMCQNNFQLTFQRS